MTSLAPADRLDFMLPDFTRISWVSDDARTVWEPRINRIMQAWFDIEWRAVLDGVRCCGLASIPAERLPDQASRWAAEGLNGLPLEAQGSSPSYASTTSPARLGQPFLYRVVIGSPGDVTEFRAAWSAHDDAHMATLLGYPKCCHAFFQETWVDARLVDTTWPMAVRSAKLVDGGATLDVAGPPETNILWRWMGVRAVPHLPCSFGCAPSADLGRRFIQVGRESGFDREMDWMLEVLSWPVEWSALHGIAEIRTPIVKVSSRTDATRSRYVVRRAGVAYPTEGARGLKFPYQVPRRTQTESSMYQRGLENPIQPTPSIPPWYATDNGFESFAAMRRAHRPIVDVARAALGARGGNVVDLGCGNGALLNQILSESPRATPFGIDSDEEHIAHARLLFPQFSTGFIQGQLDENEELWTHGRRYSLAILMPGRLIEAGPERAARFRHTLATQCDQLLVYAYGPWLTKFRDLNGLARRAGLALLSAGPDSRASLATYSMEDQ